VAYLWECFSLDQRSLHVMDKDQLILELQFKAIRSSGPGGQHVNKVSSKIELSFAVQESLALSDKEKELISEKLANRINKENILLLQCDESRSQHKNKELVIKRFVQMITEALIIPQPRKKLKPSRAAKLTRLNNKKHQALKKESRRRPER